MIVSQIVAIDNNSGIGKGNRLPWHLPTDLKRFKQLTMGHCLIMGRKTFETIGRPLPGRTMIVLTREKVYKPTGCTVAHSIEEAINIARKRNEIEVFIIGGGDVFAETMDLTDKIYLTHVCAKTDVDTYYPPINDLWKTLICEGPYQGERDEYSMCFKILIRKIEHGD